MTPTEQDKELRDKISSLLADDYACTRVWEAWQVGTMAENDFIPLSETERVDEFMQLITADRKRVALESEMNAWKQVRKSYPKKQTLQGNAVSKLTLADVDRKITELKAQQEEV